MLLSDFDYFLPQALIAQHPCEKRDHSRLLVLSKNTGDISHKMFYNIKDYILPGDTLVFNDTKVIPARLIGTRQDTGGKLEVFLLNHLSGTTWEVLVKPGKRARLGTIIEFGSLLKCEILSNTDFGGRIVRFIYDGIFEEILDQLGETPLPPYIKEKLKDKTRYQTVYARNNGSAAAPTAGLHFTTSLMDELKQQGVNLAFITLHVGLGTFRPVNVSDITKHEMHKEYYSIPPESAELINQTKKDGHRIIAVGTTAVRTLETAGETGNVNPGSGWTNIFIYPGYQFNVIDGLITNFHLPQSTLLMLVSALAGREPILNAYRQAVEEKYRFFSFGDAMFII